MQTNPSLQQLLSERKLIIREATTKDDQALKNLIAVPITTRGIQISFQREPSYFKASDVLYKTKYHVVIEDVERQRKVACYSNGFRPCYINGQIQNLRYVCDLRVDHNYRGKSLVKVVGAHIKETMHEPNFSQLIIFNDNHAARAAVQTAKAGMPDYYDEGLIETLTLTGFTTRSKLRTFLNKNASDISSVQEIRSCIAQPKHISIMSDFIAEMAKHYNFIPAYDFAEFLHKDRYFSSLRLSDFSLYFKNERLVGMFGLWDQHQFKQTKILYYSPAISVLRPIYNLCTHITKSMPLPKLGDSLKYHVLHTLLCHPESLALHHQMVVDAYEQSKQQGIGAISFTLSHRDPRYQLNQFYKGEQLIGMHGFVSFEQNPCESFDHKLIPYLEVGRI